MYVEEMVQRMVLCGYSERHAEELCDVYIQNGKWASLESFIKLNEMLYNDAKEYPKEEHYGMEF